MILLPRKQDQGIVIDDRIFMTVTDIREYDVCFAISAPGDVMIRGTPRMFGYPGRSESGEQLDFLEIAPCPKCLWLRINDVVSFNDLASIHVVVGSRDDTIRLGIKAARDVSAHRREIWEALKGDT